MKDKSDIPFIYDAREPSPKDRRDYPDYKLEDVRTINIRKDSMIRTMRDAEQFLHDKYRFRRLIAKKSYPAFFSFKIVGRDSDEDYENNDE